MLELSNQGKDLMDKVFIQHQKNLRNVLDVLDENEERTLQKSLIKIGKRAKTINET
jgi:hypothetical protein